MPISDMRQTQDVNVHRHGRVPCHTHCSGRITASRNSRKHTSHAPKSVSPLPCTPPFLCPKRSVCCFLSAQMFFGTHNMEPPTVHHNPNAGLTAVVMSLHCLVPHSCSLHPCLEIIRLLPFVSKLQQICSLFSSEIPHVASMAKTVFHLVRFVDVSFITTHNLPLPSMFLFCLRGIRK